MGQFSVTILAVAGSNLSGNQHLASTSSMSHDPIVDAGGAPIAFAASERMEMFPDVPTLQELGVDQVMEVGRVMVAPSGVPDEVLERLTAALDTISTNEEMIETFANAALPYAYLGHEAVNEKVQASNEAMGAIIEAHADKF